VRGDRRQQVLDGMDRRRAVADRRAALDGFHLRESRRDFRRSREIDAPEHDALPRGRRKECRFRCGTGV